MHCKNCGWPNRPEETSFSKCGSPLEASSMPHVHPENSSSKQTIKESNILGMSYILIIVLRVVIHFLQTCAIIVHKFMVYLVRTYTMKYFTGSFAVCEPNVKSHNNLLVYVNEGM